MMGDRLIKYTRKFALMGRHPCTPGQGRVPVKGFHLTKGWLPDAAKHPTTACQGVVAHGWRPDANALQASSCSGRAFTIRVAAALMRSTAHAGVPRW